jgi:hypothetical protein
VNAVLHSQSAGQFFTVRADRYDTWCRLEVEDGGGPRNPALRWTPGRVVWARLTW